MTVESHPASDDVREIVADLSRTAGPEPVHRLAGVADELVAQTEARCSPPPEDLPMMRTPSGRLVPVVPLHEPIVADTRPFRRSAGAEPSPRWVSVFLAVCAVLFVPYILALAFTLPTRDRTAWVGVDVMELLAIAATAWFAWTRSTWVAMAASMAATLVVADGWFDIVTARNEVHRMVAIVEAVVIELPFAAFCLWIARHAEVVADRATRLLLGRSARQAERLRQLEFAREPEPGRPLEH